MVEMLCQHVKIDMVLRLIQILKPIQFQGSKHELGVDAFADPALAQAICTDVATALQICNDMLVEEGLAPLGLVVEGHTSASLEGEAESERISGLRALACGKAITGALKEANPCLGTIWGKPMEYAISFKGHGSKVRLKGFDDGGNYAENRRVEMRLVTPGQPGYFQGGTVPSSKSLSTKAKAKARNEKASHKGQGQGQRATMDEKASHSDRVLPFKPPRSDHMSVENLH
jgi:hypothetical protein